MSNRRDFIRTFPTKLSIGLRPTNKMHNKMHGENNLTLTIALH